MTGGWARRAALALVVGATALAAGPRSDLAAARATCSAADSRTLLQTHHMRVFSVSARYGPGRSVRACWRTTGRTRSLGYLYETLDFGAGGIRHFRAAGDLLAYEESFPNDRYMGSSYTVVVVSVRRARTLRRVSTGPLTPSEAHPPDHPFEHNTGIGPITGLVLRANGAVAWIARDLNVRGPASYQVRKLDGRHTVLLGSGTDVEPRSLRLVGSHISWTQAHLRQSAPLG